MQHVYEAILSPHIDASENDSMHQLPKETDQMRCDASTMPYVHSDWSEMSRTAKGPVDSGYDERCETRHAEAPAKTVGQERRYARSVLDMFC